MTPRELAGEIRRASDVLVWVLLYAERDDRIGLFVRLTKAEARAIVELARDTGGEVKARVRGRILYIGA